MPAISIYDPAILHLKSHWKSGKSLKEVAEQHALDSGNLERAFRKREGMTIKQFIDQKRKQYVLARLTKGFVLGFEIGDELGFADDLAFYRWVKRALGVSFAELRRQSNDKKQ